MEKRKRNRKRKRTQTRATTDENVEICKDKRTFKKIRSVMTANSDREEGEISDDENEIILRIQEYESTNRELEQIAQISNSYTPYETNKKHEINLISDLSSISSDELTIPTKRRHRTFKAKKKHKEHKKQCIYRHISRNHSEEDIPPNECRSDIGFISKEYDQTYERLNDEYDSNSKNSIKILDDSDESDNESRAVINREKLRIALTHSSTKEVSKASLKERLQKEKDGSANIFAFKSISDACDPDMVKYDKEEEKDDISEERELRMIALKSAVLKKHLARKKRNAELAYSPTDFDATLASSNNVEDNEVGEIPIYSMDTSPMSSPSSNMSLSMSPTFADNKIVDMDIASSDSDVEMIMYDNGQSNHIQETIPSMSTCLSMYEENIPPPPPYIFHDYNNIPECKMTGESLQASNLETDDIVADSKCSSNGDNIVLQEQSQINNISIDNDMGSNVEEEEALRALLLSKLGSSVLRKNNSKKQDTCLVVQENKAPQQYSEESTTYLTNNENKVCQKTEMILKKAVLRLNNISTVENSINSDIENTRCNGQFQVSSLQNDLKTIYKNGQSPQLTITKTENYSSTTIRNQVEKLKSPLQINTMKSKIRTTKSARIRRVLTKSQSEFKQDEENGKVIVREDALTEIEKQSVTFNSDLSANSKELAIKCKDLEFISKKKRKSISEPYEHVNKFSAISRSKSLDEIEVVNNNEIDIIEPKVDNCTKLLTGNVIATNSTPSTQLLQNIVTKIPTVSPASPAPIVTKTVITPTTTTTNASRLITSVNLPDLKVKKLIIRVNASDSEDDCKLSVVPAASTIHNNSANTTAMASNMTSTNFEDRINTFLKNIRLNATNENDLKSNNKSIAHKDKSINFITPQAVKHLPKAAQQEYLRLVNRMNLLQQKKQIRNKPARNENMETAICAKHKKPVAAGTNDATKTNNSEQPEDTLKGYESSLRKISVRIISHLDKSLSLVQEAKSAKILKLRSEQRLKKLRAELEEEEKRYQIEQQKIQKISPAITVANDAITTLKQKRLRLLKLSSNLGRSVRGIEYRSTNEFKHEISLKSKKLASSIKVVNSIKLKNLEEFDTTQAPISSVEEKMLENPISQTQENENQKDGTETPQMCETTNVNEVDKMCIAVSSVHNENEKSSAEETHNMNDVPMPCVTASRTLQEYISPLPHSKRSVNPDVHKCTASQHKQNFDGIVCPYELMGECKDVDCIYVHLDAGKSVP